MKDDGERLGVVEFGRRLIESGDLDPLYLALWHAKLTKDTLCRWLVCYWCYYHAGLCCWVCDQKQFFPTLLKIAKSGTDFPRGTERRHFRGKLAVDSVTKLSERFDSAIEIVEWLAAGGPTAAGVTRRIKQLHGFGEWISWKVPDMIDRLNLGTVRFVPDDVSLMFKTSKEGAIKTCEVCSVESKDQLRSAHSYLKRKLGKLLAPPRYERRINVQETETIFCKWKSHLGGHYPLGKDTHEIRVGLREWRPGVTSRKLLKGLRDGLEGCDNGY